MQEKLEKICCASLCSRSKVMLVIMPLITATHSTHDRKILLLHTCKAVHTNKAESVISMYNIGGVKSACKDPSFSQIRGGNFQNGLFRP